MSKLITASIDLTKVDKSQLFNGKFLNLIIWVNDELDKFGNDISIRQKTERDAPKIYIGNGKTFVKKEETNVNNTVQTNDLPF